MRNSPRLKTAAKLLLIAAILALLVLWLRFTPPGLLGKADAVGYAVCHRIDLRSFHLGSRPLPLCARCSGMYLGALASAIYQLRKGRRGGLPPRKLWLPLGLLGLAFAVDGTNSYLHFFPGFQGLYEPNNTLRLISGTGLGLLIPTLLLPAFHQTAWAELDPRPALDSWRSLAGLLLAGAGVVLLMLSGNPLILYPLALLSSATVLAILSTCYGLLVLIVVRGDGQARSLRDLWLPLVVGFAIALLQTFAIDWLRLTFTGTWNGFKL
ncbi:predicted membrane protein [Longilinea arvoryzae]|uniref:Predicted membrane protein n=1 Tax=Longilinea arvoryzae TaxID=360412 RepID=A0A0S7B8I9_9CHLR|nr:DUF2085 domain-containing protein [Longilinea arvoryzae]GAP13823.1 predicted membrane protein [Longilinea arvoryzae]